MIDAVVLAGATNSGPLREVSDAPNEALIDINGRPMIHYVLRALRDSGAIRRLVLVGPRREFQDVVDSDVEIVESVGTLMGNLMAGLGQLSDSPMALIATSDIPFLTPESVSDFVKRCSDPSVDVYYSVVERVVADKRFPGVQRTYVKLVDGEFTGGNIVIMRPDKLLAAQETFNSAIALRKKPLALARMLGLSFILRFIMKRLRIRDIEARAGAMLGLVGKAVITPYPEVGVDVDKPSDLELARKHIK